MKSITRKMADEEIVQIILSGNNKAFEIIYDRYASKVFSKCVSFAKDRSLAEDYTHDIFLKVFINLSNFRMSAKFSTWLYAISFNYCVDQQKAVIKKRLGQHNYYEEELETIIEPQDEQLFQIELERLKSLLYELPAEDRMLLLLKYQDEFSIKQLAEIYQLKESAVKMRLKRNKAKIMEMYTDKYAHNVI